MKNTQNTINAELLKKTIETRLNKVVNFVEATDGANLLYSATINGCTVANVYKSFDVNFNSTTIIRYNNESL
jgi:hypothetical protein